MAETTLKEFGDRWLDAKRRLKPKTRDGYLVLLRARIYPAFGDHPLGRIDRLSVERWVGGMVEEGLSPTHIRHCARLLRAILDAAVDDRYLTRNPAVRVELPKMVRPEHRFLDASEVARLAEAMRPEHRALVLVMAYGGLRYGEAAALRCRHVDFLRRRILVTDAMANVSGRVIFHDTKTGRGRTVSLPSFVVEELAAHYERSGLGSDPDALVFVAPMGGPLIYGNFRRNSWNPARKLAGLDDVTPHHLRHSCASILRAMGADAKAIQSQLGHSSIQVTLDVYTHLFEGDLDDVMGKLDTAHREVGGAELREVK
ncbi:tyrosine-type recombinase/integrase [Egicoccus halophilus]|nr:site-specific integrase [Egicoccus halophilus]